jgi:hypothetical protein
MITEGLPMNNRQFVVFAAFVFFVGALFGYLLSWHPSIKPHKILFIIGSVYNLLAVIVLSEVFITIRRHKEISLNFIAPAVLWINTLMPLGAVLGAFVAKLIFNAPGNKMAIDFSWGVFAYSLIPLFLFDMIVVFPRKKIFADLDTRWRYFGLFLITSGILIQLIASIIDIGF